MAVQGRGSGRDYLGESRDESDTRAPKRPRDMADGTTTTTDAGERLRHTATAENEIDIPGWGGFPEREVKTPGTSQAGDYEEWVDYQAGELEGPSGFTARKSLGNEAEDDLVMVGNEKSSVSKVLGIQKTRLGPGS